MLNKDAESEHMDAEGARMKELLGLHLEIPGWMWEMVKSIRKN